MADLYGGAAPSPASEPEEISSFLQQLLHNSSSSATAAADLMDCHHRSSEYSDPGGYFSKRSVDNTASSGVPKRRGVYVESDLNDLSFDSEKGGSKGSELPSDTVLPRSSSKRSRDAEVHNLSEKRRRSRINEKMKALQNLIPNSNKTDKASMLDEAIEYLKQLQLQVQMLTMRNGLSLRPLSLPGVLHPMQLPLAGMSFDEENGLSNMNLVAGTFSANEEPSAQPGLTLPEHCVIPNQSVAIPSGANINSSETSFSFEPLIHIQAQYGPFSLSTSSKEICREGPTQAQLDTKASSSGVS